ncbi:MAG: hypothetical protein AAGE01_21645 [Pseudomonadota bacterium]
MPKIIRKQLKDKALELRGSPDWKAGEVVVMQALTDTDVGRVKELRSAGETDTRIWRALRPEMRREELRKPCPKTAEFSLSLEQLTKAQLIMIVEATMKSEMDSLGNLTQADLIKLIRNFGEVTTPRVTLTPKG